MFTALQVDTHVYQMSILLTETKQCPNILLPHQWRQPIGVSLTSQSRDADGYIHLNNPGRSYCRSDEHARHITNHLIAIQWFSFQPIMAIIT